MDYFPKGLLPIEKGFICNWNWLNARFTAEHNLKLIRIGVIRELKFWEDIYKQDEAQKEAAK